MEFGITRHSRLRNCGTANVYPAAGKEAWGIVYDISDSDLLILDSFEDGYRREILSVYPLEGGWPSHFSTCWFTSRPLKITFRARTRNIVG